MRHRRFSKVVRSCGVVVVRRCEADVHVSLCAWGWWCCGVMPPRFEMLGYRVCAREYVWLREEMRAAAMCVTMQRVLC